MLFVIYIEYKDVCYYAKIRILKQITTIVDIVPNVFTMFVTMQR